MQKRPKSPTKSGLLRPWQDILIQSIFVGAGKNYYVK
nr:MAG TPA_asm: hypothetical protein [Caudoviricetes sp.]